MVTERYATLREIEEHWSLMDLIEAHAAIEAVEDAQRRQNELNSKKK